MYIKGPWLEKDGRRGEKIFRIFNGSCCCFFLFGLSSIDQYGHQLMGLALWCTKHSALTKKIDDDDDEDLMMDALHITQAEDDRHRISVSHVTDWPGCLFL